MAWHKFATIKTDGNGYAAVLFQFGCASAQGVDYEVHVVAETKPDTISAINSGSSSFETNTEGFVSLINQSPNTSYQLWLDLTTQTYTSLYVDIYGGTFTVPSVNLSNSVLDVATYSLDYIGLQTITGIDELTALNILSITGNGLSTSNMDAIVADLWDYAITNAKTGGTFSYATGNDALSTTSGQIVDALVDSMQWNSGTGAVTAITNEYELQAIGIPANLGLSYVLMNDIDAAVTETWNDGAGFVPIGALASPFTGKIKGNGCKIINLWINRPSVSYLGFIGAAARGCLVEDLYIHGNVTGLYYCGIMYGWGDIGGSGNIVEFRRCFTAGNLTCGSVGGGFTGTAYSSVCKNCATNAVVTGGSFVGAFAGRGFLSGNLAIIENCFAYNSTLPFYGITSVHYGAEFNCYQLTAFPMFDENKSEGYAKDFKVSDSGKSYAALQVQAAGEVQQLTNTDYWRELDITTLTSAEFRNKTSFVGFDFDEKWYLNYDKGYPMLLAFGIKMLKRRLRSRLTYKGRR